MVKKKKSIVFVGAGLAVLVFIYFLPTLLSSDFILRKGLARINAQPGLSVNIQDCNIGWKQGLTCSGVEYSDVERGYSLTAKQVIGSQGVLALVAAPKNIGTFLVQHPVVTFIQQSKKDTLPSGGDPSSAAVTEKSPKSAEKSPSTYSDTNKAPFWDTLAVTLEVKEGQVVIQGQEADATALDGTFSSSFALAAGTVQYDLQWLAGDEQGELLAEGYVNLPARRHNIFETLVARMQLQVSKLQISPLLTAIAALKTNVPTGSGQVNGRLTVTGAGFDSLDVVGRLQCTDVELSGGVLGQDHPRLDNVSLEVDGSKKGEKLWRIADLALNGDFGKVSAKGAFDRDVGQVSFTGNLQIPVLLAQLPQLLRVHQKTSVSKGELNFVAELDSEGPRQHLTTDATVDSLQGVHQKRPFSWEKAAALTLAAEHSENGIDVEELQLDSSFLQVNGKGNLKELTFQVDADLDKASQELSKLFTLQWSGSGRLSLQGSSRIHDENRYGIDFQVESPELTLRKEGQVVLPKHPLHIKGKLNAPAEWLRSKGTADLQLDGAAGPGTFTLHAGELQRLTTSFTGNYELSSQLHLPLITDLLHNLQVMPEESSLAGEVQLAAAGFLTENQVVLRDLDLLANDFYFFHEGIAIEEDEFILHTSRPAMEGKVPVGIRKLQVAEDLLSWQDKGSGLSAFDWMKRQLFVRDMELRSALSDLDIKELIVADLHKPLQSWRAELQGQAYFVGISTLLRDTAILSPDLNIAGQGRFVLLADQLQAPHELSFDLDIPRFSLALEDRALIADGPVDLSTRLSGLLTEGDLQIEHLELNSPPLALQAKGTLLRTEKKRLLLNGEQTVDFSKINRVLSELTGTTVTLQGRAKNPFALTIPLTPETLATGSFSSTLQVDSLNWTGITVEQLSLPVSLEAGALHGGGHGKLNGGHLDVDGSYLLSEKPPHIAIPPGQVLRDVQLDQSLSEGILAKIHPLFGVLARPTGMLSGRLDTFYWPVVENSTQQAKFTTVFDTSAIQLVSHGVLQEILALLQVSEQALTLKESEVTCSGVQGRISCTPLQISVAESEMTISGSIGMDQTLVYLLVVPVTKQLVGREGYRLLEGTTIKIPLRGTLGDPSFNKNLISEAISELVGKASEKVIKQQAEKLLPGLLKGLQP